MAAFLEECSPDVVVVTEHWKSEDQMEHCILQGYKLVANYCREKGQHGGSAIFVKNKWSATSRDDFKILSVKNVFECSACVCFSGNFKFLVICIYRPPTHPSGDVDLFFSRLIVLFEKLLIEKIKFVLAGDFNLNLFDIENRDTQTFLDIIESYSVRVTINEPTRVTLTSATCIDNILTNISDGEAVVKQGHISDHQAQIF